LRLAAMPRASRRGKAYFGIVTVDRWPYPNGRPHRTADDCRCKLRRWVCCSRLAIAPTPRGGAKKIPRKTSGVWSIGASSPGYSSRHHYTQGLPARATCLSHPLDERNIRNSPTASVRQPGRGDRECGRGPFRSVCGNRKRVRVRYGCAMPTLGGCYDNGRLAQRAAKVPRVSHTI